MINMYDVDFVSDMADEAAVRANFGDLTQNKELSYGIIQRFINLKNRETAKAIGRETGVYVTYDCPGELYSGGRCADALTGYISKSLRELIGIIKKSDSVLIIGLGNDDVSADSLGSRAVSKIIVNRHEYGMLPKTGQCVCAVAAGVYGATGIKSIEIARALTEEIKPCAVILIDSLATATVGRLGASFQLSTTGIAPGSGVNGNRERIDKSVLGVPVVAVGVPLVLSMRTLVSGFVKDYLSDLKIENDEYRLRAKIADRKLSTLIVAPKEIKELVRLSSDIISSAINKAFSL